MEEKDYFFCYDHSLMVALKKRGVSYICCALHKTTHNKFWLFKKTSKFEEAIKDISK